LGALFSGHISKKCKKLLMVHQELGEGAVELNRRVLRINFRVTYPGQVNNRETVRRVSMAEQYVIAALGITKRLHWQAINQMPTGQLALKLCFKTLRHAGIGPLPSLRETVNICWHHFTPNIRGEWRREKNAEMQT
jgi:hypothetical protein